MVVKHRAHDLLCTYAMFLKYNIVRQKTFVLCDKLVFPEMCKQNKCKLHSKKKTFVLYEKSFFPKVNV